MMSMPLFSSLNALVLLYTASTVYARTATAVTAPIQFLRTDGLQRDLNMLRPRAAAFLVFFMQAGFALLKTGLTRAKNVVNILRKNLMGSSLGSIFFYGRLWRHIRRQHCSTDGKTRAIPAHSVALSALDGFILSTPQGDMFRDAGPPGSGR